MTFWEALDSFVSDFMHIVILGGLALVGGILWAAFISKPKE